MRICVLTPHYPTPKDPYNFMFVHRRAKLYDLEHSVKVYSINNNVNLNYEYENINVVLANETNARESIVEFNPDVIFIHAPTSKWQSLGYDIPNLVNKLFDEGYPYAVWIHGQEALIKSIFYPLQKFDRRLPFPADLGRFPLRSLQLASVRKFLSKTQIRGLPIIFVSDWLRDAVSKSLLLKFEHSKTIPNPIDNRIFSYEKKPGKYSTKLLSIRPFKPKYAVEDSIRAVAEVSGVHLDIFGDGPGYQRYLDLINKLDANVKLHRGFLQPEKISSLHTNYGVYLTPSRTDSQGVSMCEAMASGLAVISSDTQGIPEFISHGTTGFLTNSISDLSYYIRYLRDNPDKMQEIGKQASMAIEQISGSNTVLNKDLKIAQHLDAKFDN